MDCNDLSNKEKKEQKNMLMNLKNINIIKNIINGIKKGKFYEIIRYNKNCQKRLSLSFKDFKEFSEIYSSIEIEIIPVDNKYGKFININKNEESYYKRK